MDSYSRKEFLKTALLVNLGLLAMPSGILAAAVQQVTADSFAEEVIYYRKGEAAYETLRQGYNRRLNFYPAVIAVCKNAAGVVLALAYARQQAWPVTVKSGGHCMEGFSANDGGMVINLSLLNGIEWLPGNQVRIGPACTLAAIYETLLAKGRLLPGGSCGGVGIGGLTLGGGYGLLSRSYGLTCDSLTGVTLVDGTGKVHTATADSDLLWACRGGANGNFGVVTSLTFQTHKAPAALQSLRFRQSGVDVAKARLVLEQWFEAAAALPNSCFSAFIYNGRATYILLATTDKTWAGAAGFIAQLSKVAGKLTKTRPQPLAKALKVFYGQPQPVRFKNASAGLYRSFTDIEGCINDVLDIVHQSRGMIYQVNTLGGRIQDAALAAQSAFPHRDCIYFSELQTYWDGEKQGARLMEQFAKVQQRMAAHGIAAQYRNYPDIDFTNPLPLYYGSSLPRLQQLKRQYDPGNLIRHAQSVYA